MSTSSPNLHWQKLAGALALSIFLWPAARRRRWPFAVLFLLFTGLAISGCGSNESEQAKPYSITITATSGTLTQSTVLHLTLDN
jgi:hypothetical protein